MISIATKEDIDFLHTLYMHPTINPFLLYEAMDKDAFMPILNDLINQKRLYIYANQKGKPIGMFKLIPHTYRSAHIVYLGGVAIHPDYMGKGLGAQMLKNIIDFAIEKAFLRIELSVAAHNSKAIYIYEKVGFKVEGLMKKYTFLQQENRYINEILMAYVA